MKSTFRPTRRFFLKQATTGALALGLFPLMGCAPAWGAAAKTPAAPGATGAAPGGKPLVVYFSRSGNTRRLAELIHKRVGGDILEITPVTPYPADYQATVDQAKREQADNARPAVNTTIADPGQYSVIFLGYPNWWSSMPMPVWTFVEQNGLDGKTIAPFCTHGGGGMGPSESDLKKLLPHARVLKGLAVRGTSAGGAEKTVEKWLEGLGNALIETTTGNPAIYPDGAY